MEEIYIEGQIFDRNAPLAIGEYENCVFNGHDFGDFRTSYNYTIDPETNRIKKARFAMDGIAGLLRKYDIAIEK